MSNPKLSELIEKNVVKKEKSGYYYIEGGLPVFLDKNPLSAHRKALKYFHKEHMDLPGHSLPETSSQGDGSIQKTPENIDEKKAVDAELDMLIGAYKGRSTGGDLDIFVGGVIERARGSKQYPESHPVNRIPVKFVWKKRSAMVKNGDGYRAGNTSVLNRRVIELLQHEYSVEIRRDDTPECDYICAGEMVLCGIKYSDWDKEQQKKSFEGAVAPTKHLNARNERARRLTAQADSDPNGIDRVAKEYQNDRESHITELSESQHASEYLKRPSDDIRAEISKKMSSDLSVDEMKKIQEQLLENSIPIQM